jgi:hypothetical protein
MLQMNAIVESGRILLARIFYASLRIGFVFYQPCFWISPLQSSQIDVGQVWEVMTPIAPLVPSDLVQGALLKINLPHPFECDAYRCILEIPNVEGYEKEEDKEERQEGKLKRALSR